MSDTTNIGRHLRELREEANIDTKRFAAFLGLDEDGLAEYEGGRDHMRVSVVRRACDLFQTNLDEMVANELPERVIAMAHKISDIDRVDDETLGTLADVGRIANDLLEMRRLVEEQTTEDDGE